jgi:hypothetical protein
MPVCAHSHSNYAVSGNRFTLIEQQHGGRIVDIIDRRSALLGLTAASVVLAFAPEASAQLTAISKGVQQRLYGENPSMIPGFKTVRIRDIIFQPGAKFDPRPMNNPMVCHMAQGELQIMQGNPNSTFTAKTHQVWTCNTGMTEGATNAGKKVAVMRVTDLLA